MVKTFQVNYLKAASHEYKNLDGSQKIFIDKAIARIEHYGMNCGQELHGALIGYRKLKNRKMGLRIIFGKAANSIEIIDIIAIGKRADNEVYNDAVRRLNK
ncbi:toxin RelE [Paucilactobacillus hokkaidonensis JCM 18461]|uniref:Toxin RelE n=2 Tax=Paucilactobacillus hokkaidonensis TaxID=1193095 RepID=A0A0A1GXL2_9LACO|nr:hypothetical protein [Paucilactobacillus hokkaidonensis]KRO10656.1 hypothetical protein IV59_GL001347 [Paucilactobacillus hokkaidonensis]BAP85648.1 toxin RelE [Paucilactobacillus hokkaidonensis JCM 18461]